jgi:hypothetical protein
MNERAVLALLSCGCALLGLVLFAELHGAGPGDPAAGAQAVRLPAAPAARPALRAPKLARLVATTLARPLFSPTRRPPPQAGGADSGIADMRLTGIVTAPGERLAIFAVAGAKPLVVKEGEEVSGWRIDGITPGAVSVSGPGGTVTLRPKSDKRLARGPRAATVAPAPGAPFAGPAGLARMRFLHPPAGPGFAPPVRPAPVGSRK